MEQEHVENGDVDSDNEELTLKRKTRVLSFSDDDDQTCATSEPLKDITNVEPDNPVISVNNTSENKFRFKSNLITDSDVESDNESNGGGGNGIPDTRLSLSEYEEIPSLGSAPTQEKQDIPNRKTKKSSKKKLDDKLAIRSETQRLEREMTVHLPYHRPKQRSLREFLSRKKNQLDENSLRLSSPNMIQKWEEIDKSIKETADFFKSESEEEYENDEPEPEKPEIPNEVQKLDETDNQIMETENDQPNEKVVDPAALDVIGEEDNSPEIEQGEELSDGLDALEPIADLPIISRKEKASMWLDDVAAFEKRENFKNKLQLSPTILNRTPTLSNDFDEFIDLEEPAKTELKPGVKQLMDRMFKGLQKKSSPSPLCLTTTFTETDDSGCIKNIGTETISLTPSVVVIVDNDKPGAKRQMLKEKLRMEIEAKWEKEFKERCAAEPVKEGFEDEVEECEEAEPELDEDEDSSTESETEPEESDTEIVEKPRKFCAFGDSEAEELDDDAGCDGDDETDEDDENNEQPENPQNADEDFDCSMLPAFQPGGGLQMGGSILSQQSQPLPIKPFSPLSSPTVSTQQNVTPKLIRGEEGTPCHVENLENEKLLDHSSVKKNLFGNTEEATTNEVQEEDPDDPFLFVSGAFPETRTECNNSTSQFQPKRIILPEDESEDSRGVESYHECPAGDDDAKSTLGESATIIDDNDDVDIAVKKKNKQLVFSDDEEEEPPQSKDIEDEPHPIEDEEEPAVGIDDVNYDSEENEVQPGEFFEQEAELSESEWSGDEDEKGLDAFEAEAGDADVFDDNKVANQLGRIHMRRVLDEDARDVRRLQELLLEDGDLYTEGGPRERNFRWKNVDGFDWSSVYKVEEGANGDVIELSDRAKIRFEKKQFILKAQQEGKLQDIEELTQETSSVLVMGRKMLQRVQPQNTPSSITTKHTKSLPRGSFLTKDKQFLSRVAQMTAGGNDAPLLGASNSRNFVFAVQEKTDDVTTSKEGLKRKAVTHRESVKRTKLIIGENSFLEQLRSSETTTFL